MVSYVLYNLSFIEDPTRMIRAIRFEQRYDFKMEPSTLELLKKNLEENYLERVSGARIRQEIEKILVEENSLKAIRRMAELGMIRHIFPENLLHKHDGREDKNDVPPFATSAREI